MRKSIAPPSVFFTGKGFYAAILMILIHTLCFAQNTRWELGIALRPFDLNTDPYSFIAKKFLSRNTAIRLGASILFNREKNTHYHIGQYSRTFFSLDYEYEKMSQNFSGNLFAGVQFGKRKQSFYWYAATDFSTAYRHKKEEIPTSSESGGPIPITKPAFLSPTPPMGLNLSRQIEFMKTEKTLSLELRQLFGLEYQINAAISVSFEGGVYFRFNNVTKASNVLSIHTPLPDSPPNTLFIWAGGISEEMFNMRNTALGIKKSVKTL